MIKIRNRRIALLLVLAMLATMFVGVGTASAADTFSIESAWSWVAADATTDIPDSNITINGEDAYVASDVDAVYIQVDMPDGVALKAYTATAGWDEVSFNDTTLVLENTTPPADGFAAVIDGMTIKVDDGITGFIRPTVRVWAEIGDATDENELEATPRIAQVSSSDITATAKSAKTMYVGGMQEGAAITVKEVGPAAFDDMDDPTVKFTILTSGVAWEATGDQEIDETFAATSAPTKDGKALLVDVDDLNNVEKSSIVLTPFFKVQPNTTGDVVVRVSGDNIETTSFTVGKISDGAVKVTVKNAEDDFVYRGQFATFDDVSVTLKPGDELGNDDWFSITLPAGVKFADVNSNGNDGPIDYNGADIAFEGLIKNDKTAWYTVDEDADSDFSTKFKLTDFVVVADADAALGDLQITFAGAIEGSYTIGSVKDAFTVSTTPFNLQASLTAMDAADIVIKETADGALKVTGDGYEEVDGTDKYYGTFGIVLPAGVTVVGVPEVEVTEGDLEIDSIEVGEDFREIYFDIISTSNIASTITISGLEYSVLNQPALGDLTAQFGTGGPYDYAYNIYSTKALAKLVIGSLATNPTAIYVIGAPTYTVNGVVNNVVAPSYVKNNRTYLAIRDITTGMGIDPTNVMWDQANQRVTMIKGDKIVQVTIGSTTMYVNGVAVGMDVAPEMGANFRSMLPAAFIAQAFGATASWDGLTNTVTIK